MGNVILAKTSATATDIDNKAPEYVLALATLGNVTRNRNNPMGRATQGGQGKYNGECRLSQSPALS